VRRLLCRALIVSITAMGLPLPAQAGMLPTTVVASSTAKERLIAALERSDVRAQLASLGVNPLDAKARVAALTDEEAAQLAARMDTLPAGADGGALLGAIVLIFMVLLLTDILGFTHVFPFTKPIK